MALWYECGRGLMKMPISFAKSDIGTDALQLYLDGGFSAGRLRIRHFKNKLKTNSINNKPWYHGLEGEWWWGMNEENIKGERYESRYK